MKKQTMTLLVGLPCSGKSTWSKINATTETIISFDNYLVQEIDPNYNRAWDKYQALNESKKTEIFLKINASFEKAIALNENIIVDFTSLTVMDRKKWLDMTPSSYEKRAIIFNTSFDIILVRNNKRKNKTIPKIVLEDMKKRYQKPSLEERFDTLLYPSF